MPQPTKKIAYHAFILYEEIKTFRNYSSRISQILQYLNGVIKSLLDCCNINTPKTYLLSLAIQVMFCLQNRVSNNLVIPSWIRTQKLGGKGRGWCQKKKKNKYVFTYAMWLIYSISNSMHKTVIANFHSILTQDQSIEHYLTPFGVDLKGKSNLLLQLVIIQISNLRCCKEVSLQHTKQLFLPKQMKNRFRKTHFKNHRKIPTDQCRCTELPKNGVKQDSLKRTYIFSWNSTYKE